MEPWAIGDAPDGFIAGQLRGTVGFELVVDDMIGAWKLSRNRTDADRAGVAALMERSENPLLAELAATVRAGAERGRD